jgi:hypothetical protein
MNARMKKTAVLAIAALMVTVSSVPADEVAELGRRICRQYGDAVITVKMVTRSRTVYSGRQSGNDESKSQLMGVIIDSLGSAIVSLSETDPSSRWYFDDEESGDFKVENEITDIKMLMPGGEEISARALLRDKDLDLVFIRPVKKQQRKFTCIDFAKKDSLALFDQVIFLGRMGKIAGRIVSVSVSRVQGIIEKPRVLYIPDELASINGLGRPAFALSGKPVGILLVRTMASRGFENSAIPIILPAEEIVEAMEQMQ